MTDNQTIDMTSMPSGETYENTYGQYIEIFRRIAEGEVKLVINPPCCWIPLIRYLGGQVKGRKFFFPNDYLFDSVPWLSEDISREMVEISAAARPELADSLWKADMQWNCFIPDSSRNKRDEILITNYNSWFAPEIMGVMKMVENTGVIPIHDRCVLVPCAADKPYPSPLHKAVKEVVGDDYELIVCSGVVGVLPERLWGSCQVNYDSAIPNFWRLMQSIEKYFHDFEYRQIVVYSDFYIEAIFRGLQSVQTEKIFVLPIKWRKDYEDLRSEENLSKLRAAIGR